MTIDLTALINAVLILLATIITGYLIPWIKANATLKQREKLAAVVETLVFAAEQIYGSGWGQDKLRYVENKLREQGYTVDIDLIEATVHKYFGHPTGEKTEDDDTAEEESTEDEELQTESL